MTTHEFTFRPRARLVAVLGEHLISDQAVGLIELVKNSYDADATEVSVTLQGSADASATTVVVRDNGCGMTLDDITSKWLCPATGHKDLAKREARRTALGRLPLGEKGVGRFAVHQIGRALELVTHAAGKPELALRVDWDTFDTGEKYLDGAPLQVTERTEAEVFPGDQTGTQLTIRHARAPWGEKLIRKVFQTLRRLQSPLREDDSRFRVTFRCPEYPAYENIDPSDILERAHYEFRALVDAEGGCDHEYVCKHPALQRRQRSGSEDLIQKARDELQGAKPSCGPFYMNLYVWDRTSNHLQTSGVSRDELNAMCGVALFRDHMRVLPYGEPGNDWLYLDQERINDPTERIANNQVIGFVQLDQAVNLQLRDKTNREGLIENEAFLDLRALVRAALRLFTSYWRTDRPRKEGGSRPKQGTIQQARTVAVAIRASARPDIQVAIPDPCAAPGPVGVDPGVSVTLSDANGGTPGSATQAPQPTPAPDAEVVTQQQAVDRLIQNIDGAESIIQDREHRLQVMLHLAATGLAAERVAHEFGRQVRAAVDALKDVRDLLRPVDRKGPAITAIETALQTLRNEFRVLAPYESTERAQRTRNTSVAEIAELALTLNEDALTASGIASGVEGRDFTVKVRPSSLVQVLDNLVHNAWYWVGTLPEGKLRRVAVLLSPNDNKILVADTGPGISEESASHVFDPFFSMRAGGKGLGLHISTELMRDIRGRLRLAGPDDTHLVPSWATGAVLVAEFDSAIRVPDVPEETPHGA
ncbi:MAG TPA: ATP-binding protein [Streptosporangiaceae bacterium]|nr:ATP-binding protein [Streptosporangiaceae bacterium]